MMQPDSFKCPECGHRAKKTVSVHDRLRLVRINEDCTSCGYYKFEGWEKVETP